MNYRIFQFSLLMTFTTSLDSARHKSSNNPNPFRLVRLFTLGEHLNLKLVDSLKDIHVVIARRILEFPHVPTQAHNGYYNPPYVNILTFPSQIPHNYTHLHHHIAKHHPSLLESFEQGWNNLTPHLQAKFHNPITNRFPAYFHGLPHQAMRSYMENNCTPYREEWTSWTCFARVELGAPYGWGSQYYNPQKFRDDPSVFERVPVCKTLVEKMDHESSIFGLPPIHMETEALTQTELKRRIVIEAMGGCLERIQIEALLRMEQRLEKEGLEGFKSILNGESILEELLKVNV